MVCRWLQIQQDIHPEEVFLGLQMQIAVVFVHHRLGGYQPDAGALVLGGAQDALLFFQHAVVTVLHHKPQHGGTEHLRHHLNPALLRRQKATVLLLGPGLGGTAQSAARATETRTLVQQLLPGFAGAAVLDADGLNAAAQLLAEGKPFPHPAGELVVTPHPGEMARLTGLSAAALAADREGIALRYAKAWNAVVVLKGARTVVASPDGRACVNPTGNPGLARGGSGDVLAGMLAALLACGLPAYEAAACAVYLHGAAADRAAAKRGEYGMLPHDILPELGALFAENQR